MKIIFWLSLILAIPTAGVSLLLCLALYIVRAYIAGKTSRHSANTRFAANDMMHDRGVMPTWYKDPDKLELFLSTLKVFALAKGANKHYVDAALKITGDNHTVLKYAGALEKQGSTFLEQQAACSDFLVMLLEKIESGSLKLD